jgi:hypothetical protein
MDQSPGRRKHKKNFYLLITLTIMLALTFLAVLGFSACSSTGQSQSLTG